MDRKKTVGTILWLGAAILAGIFLKSSGSPFVQKPEHPTLKFPAPIRLALKLEDKMFCSAIIGSSLRAASSNSIEGQGVWGELFKGTDQVAITVKDDALHFITRASFEAGTTEDDSPFRILQNSEVQLVAIDYDEGRGFFVNLFSLNRRTGIAVWSKTRSIDLFTENPDVQSYVLACEPRF